VAKKIRTLSFRIVNVDATILAQAPRMAPHIPRMIGNIAADLELAPAAINVKATTTERLGFLGRGDGIAAQAVVLID
jgi:2-C-methyl-D-erythritol 2,4-cyclodiphosphate synthase